MFTGGSQLTPDNFAVAIFAFPFKDNFFDGF